MQQSKQPLSPIDVRVQRAGKYRLDTPYLDSLVDDFSIWQHADGQTPLPEHGYALDDATRGFLFYAAIDKRPIAKTLFKYMLHSRKGSDFYGFFNDKREPIQFPASDDAKGQVVWAMGFAVSCDFEAVKARQLIKKLAPSLFAMQAIRGYAYALLGAIYIDKPLAAGLQHEIVRRFKNVDDVWFWPEDSVTYGNGIIPYSLLRYALLLDDADSAVTGRNSLEFLEKISTSGRLRGPIGYDGWYKKGDSHPADNGQQAIDVSYMIGAWLAAYQLSGAKADLDKARRWMRWFEGENIAHTRMYEPDTLKTYDGINLSATDHHNNNGINTHSGAESNICYVLSRYMLDTRTTL